MIKLTALLESTEYKTVILINSVYFRIYQLYVAILSNLYCSLFHTDWVLDCYNCYCHKSLWSLSVLQYKSLCAYKKSKEIK